MISAVVELYIWSQLPWVSKWPVVVYAVQLYLVLLCFFVSHVHCFDRCLIFRLTKSQRAKQQGPLHDRHDFIHVSHLTNGFHVALRLFGNRSQMTSSKDEKVVHEAMSECFTDVLTAF